MLYDSLKHIEFYKGIHPGVYRALEILRDTDFSQLEDKRYEVDGDNLFFFLQSYETKPDNDTPEAHRKYIDIQFLVSGREKMGVAPLVYYSFLSPQQLKNVEEIIENLRPHIRDISFRTYYRRRREAIDALSSVLWGYTSKDSLDMLEQFFPAPKPDEKAKGK